MSSFNSELKELHINKLRRENKIKDIEGIQQEEIKQEEIEQEEIKQEEIEQEEIKQEEIKQGEIQQEEIKQEEIQQEEIQQGEIKQEEIQQEEIQQGDINKEEKRCRICYDNENSDTLLINPCKCNGTIKWVHEKCLEEWINISKKDYCPQCKYVYHTERVCNYPKLQFLSRERNIRIISFFTLILTTIFIGFIKCLFFGRKNTSKIRFLMDGLKGMIILSIIVIPLLHYKGWIDMNSIYNEIIHNSLFFGSNVGDITGIIFLVINNLLTKMVNKYIKFQSKFRNYIN